MPPDQCSHIWKFNSNSDLENSDSLTLHYFGKTVGYFNKTGSKTSLMSTDTTITFKIKS